MRLCHGQPQLFQESGLHPYNTALNKFSAYLHDIAYYFSDLFFVLFFNYFLNNNIYLHRNTIIQYIT